MSYGHPNLHSSVNNAMLRSEVEGGFWAYDPRQPAFGDGLRITDAQILGVGQALRITTRNTTYILRRVAEDSYTIQGHPRYCPTPVDCRVNGSTWGGSMLKVGWIGVGMHLEVHIDGAGTITTSVINSVELAG